MSAYAFASTKVSVINFGFRSTNQIGAGALPFLGLSFSPGVLDQSLVRGLIADRCEILVSGDFVGVRESQFDGFLQSLKSLPLVAGERAGSGQGEKDLRVVGSNLGGQRQAR